MNIESIKRRLLVKYPFFGSVVANSNFIAEEAILTAGTDGKNIYYNPNFIESITKDQQTFIFAHEICHIAFNHILRSEGKDKKIWNIATDSVINAFLKQDGLPIVEGGVNIPEAINFDAEEMYKKLLAEYQQQSQSQSNGEQKKDSNEEEKQQQDVGHDTHSMWDKAVENKHQKEQQSQTALGQSGDKDGKKQSLLDKLSNAFDNKKTQQEEQQHFDESQNKEQGNEKNEAIKKLTELGEKEAFKQNKIKEKKTKQNKRKEKKRKGRKGRKGRNTATCFCP